MSMVHECKRLQGISVAKTITKNIYVFCVSYFCQWQKVQLRAVLTSRFRRLTFKGLAIVRLAFRFCAFNLKRLMKGVE